MTMRCENLGNCIFIDALHSNVFFLSVYGKKCFEFGVLNSISVCLFKETKLSSHHVSFMVCFGVFFFFVFIMLRNKLFYLLLFR